MTTRRDDTDRQDSLHQANPGFAIGQLERALNALEADRSAQKLDSTQIPFSAPLAARPAPRSRFRESVLA